MQGFEKESGKPKVRTGRHPLFRRLKPFLRSKLLAFVAVLLAPLAAVTADAADPFYLRLLRQGTDAFNRGDYQAAGRELRIACLGLLDEPQLLADGLTRLALAQAAAGDDTGFRETFQRLSEVEERFGGYSRADIPKDVRSAFEVLVVQAIPRSTLSENAAFARLVPTRQDSLAKVPPPQRRKELNRLIKAEPTEVMWRLMLADLELGEGKPSDAVAAADGALKLAPGNKEALNLRGLALAADKKWAQAVDSLKACGCASSDPKVAGAMLTSLVELKRWQDANDFARQLPPDVAKDRTVQQLTVSAAVGLTASMAAATPSPARAAPGAVKTGEKPPAGAAVAAGVVAAGPPATAARKPADKPTPAAAAAGAVAAGSAQASATNLAPKPSAPVGVLGFVAGGASQVSATKPTGKPTVGPSPQTLTPKPAERPATGVAAAAGAGSPSAPAQKPVTTKGVLSPTERADLDRVQELAKAGMLDEAFALARKVADARPDLVEPQFVAAEMAYRTTRRYEAVVYFRLADLELADGNPGNAFAAADAALKLAPGNRYALKLRGLAATADKQWAAAVEDLRSCGLANSDPKVAGALLTCLVELKRWQEANDFAVQLPADVAKDRTVQQLTMSAAVGLAGSRPGVAPTPTRVVFGGAKVGEKPAAVGAVAAGSAQASATNLAPKPSAPVGVLGFVAGGASQVSATKPTEKPTVGPFPQTPTPKPAERPATGVAAAVVSGSLGASVQKSPTKKGPLSAAEKADLDRAQELAKAGNLDGALALARWVADARSDLAEPQFLAAELAYRTMRWNEAVAYFRRGGDPGDGKPLLLFYQAVALYETGDRAGAAAPLKRCLPNIKHTPFVEGYARAILGETAPALQKP